MSLSRAAAMAAVSSSAAHTGAALVERSADNYAGWGEVVTFAACRPRASVRCPASVKPTLTAVAGSGPSGARPHPAPAA